MMISREPSGDVAVQMKPWIILLTVPPGMVSGCSGGSGCSLMNERTWPVMTGMAMACSQLYGKNVLPIIIPKDRSMEIYVEAVT